MVVKKSLLISNLATYSITHGIVDLISAAVVFGLLLRGTTLESFVVLAIIYNVFAFGTQAVFGHIIDTLNKPKEGAIISMILLVAAIPLMSISAMASVIVVGLGNSLFHVAGGSISLNLTPKKATAPGIYVSLGALGLFIGTILGKSVFAIYLFCLPLALISILAVIFTKTPKMDYKKEKISRKFKYFEMIIILLLLVIVARAFVGTMLIFNWKSNMTLASLLIVAIVLGKALGGFFADRLGWIKVSVGGLILSAPLLAFASDYPYLAVLGALLFNFTMPVTLVALSNTIPGRPGFAFGLTTIALLIGALPALLGYKGLIYSGNLLFVFILVSAVVLFYSLKLYYRRKV